MNNPLFRVVCRILVASRDLYRSPALCNHSVSYCGGRFYVVSRRCKLGTIQSAYDANCKYLRYVCLVVWFSKSLYYRGIEKSRNDVGLNSKFRSSDLCQGFPYQFSTIQLP
jgi:hypothetical protein